MASQLQVEWCPERGSAATESKGKTCGESPILQNWQSHRDDGIVVVMHWLYILRCADNCLYIGEASDLTLRVQRHTEGRAANFTSSRRLLRSSTQKFTRIEILRCGASDN